MAPQPYSRSLWELALVLRRALLAALTWHLFWRLVALSEDAIYAAADHAEPLLEWLGVEY